MTAKKTRAGSKGLPVVRSNHHYAASTACNKPVAIVIVGRAGGIGTAVDLKVKHATAVNERCLDLKNVSYPEHHGELLPTGQVVHRRIN